VTKLARGSWYKPGFTEGVGVVSEGCWTVRWAGTVGMKGKGTCFRIEGLLLILEENSVAKQFKLEVMKGVLTITQSKGSNKRVESGVYTINNEGDEIIIFHQFAYGRELISP
jgi:hypothetical protein